MSGPLRRIVNRHNEAVATRRKLSLALFQKHLPLLLLALGLFLLPASPAAAVCPKPDPKVCGEYFKSDAVFVGSVVSQMTVPPQGNSYDGWLYRLRVSKVFRGSVGDTVEVFTENSSGRFPLDVGSEYLLFATLGQGRLEIDNCGNSGLLAETMEKIREIERIGNSADAVIEGHVASRPDWKGVPGIRFLVRGKEATHSAVTDHNGWFRMTGPPGTYSVRAESARVTPFDLTYDNPDRLVVRKGGCSQMQFVVEEK